MLKKEAARPQILTGWKEIANYLGLGVRTVQRYERLGLPIRRPTEKSRGAVMAIPSEIEGWIAAAPARLGKRMPELTGWTSRAGAKFLQTDSAIALTLTGIALQTTNPEKKRRLTKVARKAYDSIMRLRKKIDLNEAERDKLDANLQRLKGEIQRLEESFLSVTDG